MQTRVLALLKNHPLLFTLVSVLMVWVYPVAAKADLVLTLPTLGSVEASLLWVETFDVEDAWERYSNVNGVELGVEDGAYRAYSINNGFVWGLNKQEHTNVVLEVDVTPLTVHFGNGVGIMCRADTNNNGNGYYFMINANGNYSISLGKGDDILPLVEWTPSEVIRPEIDQNTIRAVCIDDDLAMYVNDELLAEVQDDTYQTGFAGLAIAAAPNTDMDASFDNVVIYEVTH